MLLEASRLDAVAQRVSCRFIRMQEQGVKVIPVELRYAWPAELDLMAELAGMRLVQRWSSWDKTPFVEGSFKHISTYEKLPQA